MEIKTISDPNDIVYPLSQDLFNDSQIVYHGTSSNFTELIEKRGWNVNEQIYDIKDIKYVCDIIESINYFNIKGDEVLRPFTLGSNNHHVERKLPSFTQDYWIARNYANNPGGETIKAYVSATNNFKFFINDEQLILNHLKKLENDLANYNMHLTKAKNLNPPKTKKDKEIKSSLKINYKNINDAISKIKDKCLAIHLEEL